MKIELKNVSKSFKILTFNINKDILNAKQISL